MDSLERRLAEAGEALSQVTAAMLPLIRALDVAQVALVDGSRSMVEWLASRLDCEPAAARRLLGLARAGDVEVEEGLAAGELSVGRAVAVTRLKAAGADAETVEWSFGLDLAGVRRMVAAHRTLTSEGERDVFASRFLHLQPSLDLTFYRMWGELAGVDGAVVEKAITTTVDRFPNDPAVTAAQARADALTVICQDALAGGGGGRVVAGVEVFVDADLAAPSRGERGVVTSGGVRVGPNTLAEILCGGQVSVTVTDPGMRPVVSSRRRNAIPPAIRRAVLARDLGMCVIDGCGARTRLQVHHLTPQTAGVDHDPDNLVTLCCEGSCFRRSRSSIKVGNNNLRLPPSCGGPPDGLPARPRQPTGAAPVPPARPRRTRLDRQACPARPPRTRFSTPPRHPGPLTRVVGGSPMRPARSGPAPGPLRRGAPRRRPRRSRRRWT